jgi:hypothetical protein
MGVGAGDSACPTPQPLDNPGIRSTATTLPGRRISVQSRLFLDETRVISSSSVHQGVDILKWMEGICHSSKPDSHRIEKLDASLYVVTSCMVVCRQWEPVVTLVIWTVATATPMVSGRKEGQRDSHACFVYRTGRVLLERHLSGCDKDAA